MPISVGDPFCLSGRGPIKAGIAAVMAERPGDDFVRTKKCLPDACGVHGPFVQYDARVKTVLLPHASS